MNICGLQKTTLLDFPGHVAATVFTGGCNFRCPFCHNSELLGNDAKPLFTEEEQDIYRRGRNAKKATKSKNASAIDYNRSTGFEAVLGFLYIVGDKKRIDELLNVADESLFAVAEKPTAFKPIR